MCLDLPLLLDLHSQQILEVAQATVPLLLPFLLQEVVLLAIQEEVVVALPQVVLLEVLQVAALQGLEVEDKKY